MANDAEGMVFRINPRPLKIGGGSCKVLALDHLPEGGTGRLVVHILFIGHVVVLARGLGWRKGELGEGEGGSEFSRGHALIGVVDYALDLSLGQINVPHRWSLRFIRIMSRVDRRI
ncbi:hypothetical protein ES703_119689 [subsurface metagenome]